MTTLLVTGSRALADTPQARWWAVRQILAALSELPYGSVLVTGDASGPDTWARDLARCAAGLVVVFGRGGWADDGRASWRWTDDPRVPQTPAAWRDRLLARDRAMVQWVAGREGERRCLALVAPWSATYGTLYTARHAKAAGITVDLRECPREYGPGVCDG